MDRPDAPWVAHELAQGEALLEFRESLEPLAHPPVGDAEIAVHVRQTGGVAEALVHREAQQVVRRRIPPVAAKQRDVAELLQPIGDRVVRAGFLPGADRGLQRFTGGRVLALAPLQLSELHLDARALGSVVLGQIEGARKGRARGGVVALHRERVAGLAKERGPAWRGGTAASVARPVARDRLVVSAHQQLHVADPLVDRARIAGTAPVGRERERGSVRGERLDVREQSLGPIAGPHEPLERLRRVVAALVVVGEQVDELVQAVSEQRLDRPADGGVCLAPDGDQLDLVGDIADEGLSEGIRELRGHGARDDELLGLEDPEAVADRPFGKQLREHPVPERAPDDRRRSDDARRRIREPVQPRLEHLGDRRREVLRRPGVRADPTVLLEKPSRALELSDDLLNEERVTAGPREDAVRERRLDRQLQHRFDQLTAARVIEWRQVDPLGRPGGRPAGTARREEQAREGWRVADQLPEHPEARVIGPMEVLCREEERRASGGVLQHRSQEPDEQGPLALGIEDRPFGIPHDLEHDRCHRGVDRRRVALQSLLQCGCRRGLVIGGVDAERAPNEVRDQGVRRRLFVRRATRCHPVDLRRECVPELGDES